jgi:hypothetical protein
VTFSDWLGVAGLIIGVLSFVYALWEKRSRARLEDYVRAQNWSLYGKASNANGHTQTALTKYKSLWIQRCLSFLARPMHSVRMCLRM